MSKVNDAYINALLADATYALGRLTGKKGVRSIFLNNDCK